MEREREREREIWIINSYFCVIKPPSCKAAYRVVGLVKYCKHPYFFMSSFLFLLVGQPSFAMPCHALTHIALTLYCTHFSYCCSMQMMMVAKGKKVTCLILMQVS